MKTIATFRDLLTLGVSNHKTAKQRKGIESVIMHLAPATIANRNTVCPWSTPECRRLCLNTSGHSRINGSLTSANLERSPIHRARIARTRLFWSDRTEFLSTLARELGALQKRADKKDNLAVARLNGTSDIAWESVAPELFDTFPRMQFYDYTKSLVRVNRFAAKLLPRNYHLTFSRTELDEGEARDALALGVSVAVVFSHQDYTYKGKPAFPAEYLGAEVIDATANDWRFRDAPGSIAGLLPMGRARKGRSGFIVTAYDVAGSALQVIS